MNRTEFMFDGQPVESLYERVGERFKVVVGEKTFELQPYGDNLYLVQFNGKKLTAAVAESRGVYYIDIDSVLLEVREPSQDSIAGGAADVGAADKIFAPMPGKIVKIMAEVGGDVREKQALVIVEAMKMENPVLARAKGKVKAIHFAVGDQVDTESPIIELELEEG